MNPIKLKQLLLESESFDPTVVDKFAELLKLKRNDINTPRWVQNRLAALGMGKTCGRCGGTGQYSFRQDIGTMCLKCGGTGKVIRDLTQKLYDEAKSLVDSGKLEEYLKILRLKKKIKDSDISIIIFGTERFFTRQNYTDNRPDLSDPYTGVQHDIWGKISPHKRALEKDYAEYIRAISGPLSGVEDKLFKLTDSYEKFRKEYNDGKKELMQKFPEMKTFDPDPNYPAFNKGGEPGNKFFHSRNSYNEWMKELPALSLGV